ncbi:unnamed protein product [Rotaria sp. Silwood1]|nr:unnamed protein product [Rotaria sp. Silwood1]CAF3934442.1 unnamed protein product [Rotaria sp. Silwood1]CAF4950344.1 unnamed protein product [Rotaria sp. Silwood1]CAF5079078.1 unnamed protein product [Rotaria sp. Silwood1]
MTEIDFLSDPLLPQHFRVEYSSLGIAYNGSFIRLAPVPLFFYRHLAKAVQCSGVSAKLTHGDKKAVDACHYYGALIVGAVKNVPKAELLTEQIYSAIQNWLNKKPLHLEVQTIAKDSFKKKEARIR